MCKQQISFLGAGNFQGKYSEHSHFARFALNWIVVAIDSSYNCTALLTSEPSLFIKCRDVNDRYAHEITA